MACQDFKTTEKSLRRNIQAKDANEDHYINAMVQTRLDRRHQREDLGRKKTKAAVLRARLQFEVGNGHQAQRDFKTTKEILQTELGNHRQTQQQAEQAQVNYLRYHEPEQRHKDMPERNFASETADLRPQMEYLEAKIQNDKCRDILSQPSGMS